MSGRESLDLLTLPIEEGRVKQDSEKEDDLSFFSPRHRAWDVHRGEADDVGEIYADSERSRHQRYAERMENCSQVLGFAYNPLATKKNKLKLQTAWFCRVRHCPVCQWRRSLRMQAKVYQALPALVKDYPDTRFLFMTLTIRNCEVKDLRKTLDVMRRAWVRLTQLRCFPARGWVRSVEVTRSQKYRTAHPHYHCLLMVAPRYFESDYLKQDQWAEMWRRCLRITYIPVVDIRAVKLALVPDSRRVNNLPKNMWEAVAEIIKYAVKPSDMVRDPAWFLELADQLHATKITTIGGILKRYIKDRERKSQCDESEETSSDASDPLYFGWKQEVRRYRKIGGRKM
jgi:plasmid rolling circle replication initiator protein Rep